MITVQSDTGTLLSYALNVTPAPLQASLDDKQAFATLQIIAVNQTGATVSLQSLEVQVLIGSNASDLSSDTDSLTANITPSSDFSPPSVVTGNGIGAYKWVTNGPNFAPVTVDANGSVVITFTEVPVNTEIGITEVGIVEVTGTESAPVSNTVAFQVTKFPFGFFFTGLAAYAQDSQKLVTQVPYNGQVTLQWTGSLTETSGYKVFYSTNAGQVTATVSTLGQWTSPPLTNHTVFTVQANSQDGAGESVTAALTTAVTVQNPDVVANSVNLGSQGSLTLGGQTISSFDQILPAGTIVMWSGAVANIPSGWALCDGTNGTPNLVSRFIYGAGDPSNPNTPNAVSPNNTGGSDTHAHTGTVDVTVQSAGAHSHKVDNIRANSVVATLTTTTTGANVVEGVVGTATAETSGSHTHPATATTTINSTTTLPPWLSLAFIMKLS